MTSSEAGPAGEQDVADDQVVRAISDDGGFRVIAARTDATARAAIHTQGVDGATAAQFAELLTGAILFRETMAPSLRVQCVLDGRNQGSRLVADSFPGGDTRGLVRLPDGAHPAPLDAGSVLRMSRAMPRGHLQEGIVELPPAGGLSTAFMAYMQESEQVTSVVAVAVSGAGPELRAGGYLLQLLPEVERSALAVMTERLTDFPDLGSMLASGVTAMALVEELLFGMAYTQLETSSVRFACPCSRIRAETALATAGREEVELALAESRILETTCDYCRTTYEFHSADLERMLLPATVH